MQETGKKNTSQVQETFDKATELVVEGSKKNQGNDELKIDIDYLKLYFREPIEIECEKGDNITLLQPSFGDIVRIGENKFYSTLNVFTTNPTANRVILWTIGLDWNDLSDYELFLMFFQQIDPEIANKFFKDIDFTEFKFYKHEKEHRRSFFYNEKQNIIIDEDVYNAISAYFRAMFNTTPKVEKTDDEVAKEWIVEEEMMKSLNNKDKKTSSLLPLVSTCVNHPGFKYNSQQLMDIGVFEFFDSVKRLQVYESATAVMKGMYSSFVDTKKINSEAYNFMKEV